MITEKKFNQAPLNKIKIENRNFIISKLETGDLIKTKAEDYPLIFHYGIIDKQENSLFIFLRSCIKSLYSIGKSVKSKFS